MITNRTRLEATTVPVAHEFVPHEATCNLEACPSRASVGLEVIIKVSADQALDVAKTWTWPKLDISAVQGQGYSRLHAMRAFDGAATLSRIHLNPPLAVGVAGNSFCTSTY